MIANQAPPASAPARKEITETEHGVNKGVVWEEYFRCLRMGENINVGEAIRMTTTTIAKKILKRLPRAYWNTFSVLLASFSLPTIGAPINYRVGNRRLREIDLLTADKDLLARILAFMYPRPEIADPEAEIAIDKQYWPAARTLIVERTGDGEIQGCIQVLEKSASVMLPVEKSQTSNGLFAAQGATALFPEKGKLAEIYRCRKCVGDGDHEGDFVVLNMLFKAVWLCAVQGGIRHSVISFDPSQTALCNMYTKKLAFKDAQVELRYGQSGKSWKLLTKDWIDHDRNFAALSEKQFFLQTWWRKNLARKRLQPYREIGVGPATGCKDRVLGLAVPAYRYAARLLRLLCLWPVRTVSQSDLVHE
jgi:hypothetical protein